MSETLDQSNSVSTSRHGAALLFIHAQTALHPGSGTALGTVDLPVQRERHTQWPIIPGSTLKGILRDAIRDKVMANYESEYEDVNENGQTKRKLKRSSRQVANEDDPMLVAAFGPGKVEQNTSHAGALNLTDARILAFPVRSIKGVFAWITCQAVFERLHRDLTLANVSTFDLTNGPDQDKAFCGARSPLLVDGNKLVLEEFEFERTGDADSLADWLSKQAFDDEFTSERLKSHLVVLPDNDFTHFVRHATEVVARVGLDYERKTVKRGALFYEEFLPPETLFYSVVLANPSRRDGHIQSASDILAYLQRTTPPVLQIGGDETIGKGICALRFMAGEEGGG